MPCPSLFLLELGASPRQRTHFEALLPLACLLLGACSSVRACSGCAQSAAAPTPTSKRAAVTAVPGPMPLDMDELRLELDARRRGGKTKVRYLPASKEEWNIYGDWVAHSARAAAKAEEPPPAPRGFRMQKLSEGALWLLSERPELRRGAGAVVLRVGDARELIVQAPHTFFDSHTLTLALTLFERSRARALLVNTAHRANVAKDLDDQARLALARSGDLSSDVAHADDAFFTSAHVALVRELPRAASVQLHGYRDGTSELAAILSGSESVLDPVPLVEAIRRVLPNRSIGAYPADVRMLGGVKNAQAKVSRRYGTRFAHIELSHALRSELVERPELRARVLDALWRGLMEGH